MWDYMINDIILFLANVCMIYASYPQIKMNLQHKDTTTHSLAWHTWTFLGLVGIFAVFINLCLYLSSVLVFAQIIMRILLIYQVVNYR